MEKLVSIVIPAKDEEASIGRVLKEVNKVINNTRNYRFEVIVIDDKSKDLVVSTLVMDLLDEQGRYDFVREAYRVLDDRGYLMLSISSKTIDPSCRQQFINDLAQCGFKSLTYFTGTYQGQDTVDVDTGDKESSSRLESYVIVAQKDPNAVIPEKQPELRLRPSYRVKETQVQKEKGAEKERRSSHLRCQYFMNVDNQLDLREIEQETGQPVEVPIKPVEVDGSYDGQVKKIVQGSNVGDLSQVLSDLDKILGKNDD